MTATRRYLRRFRPGSRQRGAALLTAMIIVTLVVTLAASMVWQQWRAVQVEAAERGRTQAAWILAGALDWARLILKENTGTNRPTTLGDPWATPLAEARLSTFLATDKSNADDGPEAFLSGSIADMQARYNLSNLLLPDGKIAPLQQAALVRLCGAIGVDPGVAQTIASGLLAATYPGTDPQANAPLLPRSVDQLGWLGVDAATIKLLAPYVVLLEPGAPVNVNTASREVLRAAIKDLDAASAERLIQLRQRSPFKELSTLQDQIPTLTLPLGTVDVRSTFFEVRAQIRLADRVLVERSLVHRKGAQIEVLRRERVASLDEVPP